MGAGGPDKDHRRREWVLLALAPLVALVASGFVVAR